MTTKTEFSEFYAALSPKEKTEFDNAIREDVAKNIWIPLVDPIDPLRPTPQQRASDSLADVLLYGGAAFGGKSNLLCGLSLTQHKRSSIFRRKKEDLMPISEELIKIRGTKKGYNSQLKRLNTEDGRNIRLAGMQYEQDKQGFKGDARDLFCVAKGTPVLMADNSQTPIEQLVVGDMVQTLEGARKVTKTFPPQFKDSVQLNVFDNYGDLLFSQIQSKDHAVLTTEGWLSHDKIAGPLLFGSQASGSMGLLRACKSSTLSPQKSLSDVQHLPSKSDDYEQKIEPYKSLADQLSRREILVSDQQSDDRSDCKSSACESEESSRLPLSSSHSGPRQPSHRSDGSSISPRALLREESSAQDQSLPEDSPEYCFSYRRRYGEQLHEFYGQETGTADGQLYLHQSGGAALPSPNDSVGDGREKNNKYSHRGLWYDHPYKKEKRQSLERVALHNYSFNESPLGVKELYDIEVEELNHYITAGGVVNKNCFDEIVDFTETQFRFVITWNRSPDPNQRCRVICTTNPPTTNEGDWIIGFWGPWLDPDYPNPALPGELRWFISDEDGHDKEVPGPEPVMINNDLAYPKSRTFIPSSIDDNPFATIAYKATLQSLPEPLRSQMLTGDFLAGREDDPWQVIPTEWVEAAMDRWPEKRPPHLKMSTIGVDTARGGKDLFVLAPRYDWWFDELVVVNGEDVPDGPKGAALCTQHVRNGASINIDIIGGSGTSVYDHLKQAGANVNPIDNRLQSHARDCTGSMGFFNKRAENYWRFREALDPESEYNIALPLDRLLKSDLTAPRWRLTARGIQIEGKYSQASEGFGALIERIGRSTDRGDAVVNAWVEGKQHRKKSIFNRPKKANSVYNVSRRWRKN